MSTTMMQTKLEVRPCKGKLKCNECSSSLINDKFIILGPLPLVSWEAGIHNKKCHDQDDFECMVPSFRNQADTNRNAGTLDKVP